MAARATLSSLIDRMRLAACRQTSCPTDRLRQLDPAELESILNSKAIASAWEAEQQALGKLALPHFTGGVNPGDQRALYYLVIALRPRRVLEIGTHIGCSTANIALALGSVARLSGEPCGELVTVDIRDVNDTRSKPWTKHGSRYSPRELVAKIGQQSSVTFHTGNSLAFLEAPGRPFDLIFLDGDHASAKVYHEMPLALARLRQGGLIVLHDYFPGLRPLWSDRIVIEGPCRAIQRLQKEGAGFAVHPLGDLPWPTKLNSHLTSLALLVSGEQMGAAPDQLRAA